MKKYIVSDVKIMSSAASRRARNFGSSLFNAGCCALVGLAFCFSGCATRQPSKPPTLKDAYKDHFYVGVAINRTIATSTAVQADNVNRNHGTGR